MKTDEAFSNVVGVVLIICLVVILAIVLFALFFGNLSLQQKSAYVLPQVSNHTLYNKNFLVVFHRGGDDVYLNLSTAGTSHMGVYIDTPANSSRVTPVAGYTVLKPGSSLYIYNVSGSYRMTDNASALSASGAQAVTACPISLRLVDEDAKILIGQWNWTDCVTPPLTGPAPTVTARSNATLYRGWTGYERITGSNFLAGARSILNRSGNTVASSGCTVRSPTELFCSYELLGAAMSTMSPPTYRVEVINPDGKSGWMTGNTVTVSSPAPTLTDSTLNTGKQGDLIAISRLRGTNFQPGAVVTYNNGSTSIPLTNMTVVSSANITGTLAIPSDAPAGIYSVTVTNTDTKTVTRTGLFTVTSNAPSVSSFTPASGNRGWPVLVTINGANFVGATSARLKSSAYPEITATACTYSSAARIICTFDLAGKNPSPPNYNVTVTNPDGKSSTSLSSFTLNSPAPTLTDSTPSTGKQGQTITISRLRGTNFQPGAGVTFNNGTRSITLTPPTVVSSTNITGTLAIPSDAPTGIYSVTLTNTDTKTVTKTGMFTVTSNAPTVTGRSNATLNRGWAGYELITGTNFVSGAQSVLSTAGGYSISSTACTVRSATQMFCSYDLLGVSPSISYRVSVTNPDGKSAMMTTNLVNVRSLAPTVASSPAFSPNTAVHGTSGVIVTAPGTNLQPNLKVVLTSAAAPTTTITADNVNVVSPTQVIFTINIPPGATLGTYSARFTNSDDQTGTRTARFSVT